MTSLAKIRVKLKKLDNDVQELREEFDEVVRDVTDGTKPLGKKKEKNNEYKPNRG